MIFMGEEWGAATPWRFFTDFDQPALAQAVRTGRREEFSDHGWQPDDIPDPQEATTRSMSVLDWSEQIGADHARLLDWYRTLITLRRNTPDIQDDHLAAVGVSYDEDARWFVLTRGQHLVVVNLGDSHAEIPLPVAERTVVLAWDGAELSAQQVVLPRRSVAVLGPAAVRAGRDAGTH
jgi:maltooligosyltrehalose trehalohydrolase